MAKEDTAVEKPQKIDTTIGDLANVSHIINTMTFFGLVLA